MKLRPGRIGSDFKAKKPKLGRLTFDLKTDLSNLFNWNTKMLFVSVIVDFENKDYNLNQVCVWDDIIMNKRDAVFDIKKKSGEYPIHDLTDSLRNTKGDLSLQIQVVPWVGFFWQEKVVFKGAVQFPEE